MVWSISERAADLETKVVAPSKQYLEHLAAEKRMSRWQAELKAKKAKS